MEYGAQHGSSSLVNNYFHFYVLLNELSFCYCLAPVYLLWRHLRVWIDMYTIVIKDYGLLSSVAPSPTDKQANIGDHSFGHSAQSPTALDPLGNQAPCVGSRGHSPLYLLREEADHLLHTSIGGEDRILRHRRGNPIAEIRRRRIPGEVRKRDLHRHKAIRTGQIGRDDQANKRPGGDKERRMKSMGNNINCPLW